MNKKRPCHDLYLGKERVRGELERMYIYKESIYLEISFGLTQFCLVQQKLEFYRTDV